MQGSEGAAASPATEAERSFNDCLHAATHQQQQQRPTAVRAECPAWPDFLCEELSFDSLHPANTVSAGSVQALFLCFDPALCPVCLLFLLFLLF